MICEFVTSSLRMRSSRSLSAVVCARSRAEDNETIRVRAIKCAFGIRLPSGNSSQLGFLVPLDDFRYRNLVQHELRRLSPIYPLIEVLAQVPTRHSFRNLLKILKIGGPVLELGNERANYSPELVLAYKLVQNVQ